MLDSDWLIAVIFFFLQIQALHCEFTEFLLHVGVFASDLTFFHDICKIVFVVFIAVDTTCEKGLLWG
jgi:hypothetical protein